MSELQYHPLAGIFPLLDGDEFKRLADDIVANGLREPVTLYDGMILDGRNRHRACVSAGVDARFEIYTGDDPAAFVISLNLHRRHLNESQRAMVAARLATLRQGDNQHAPIGATSQDRAAEQLNVGRRSVQRAREVQEHAVPELAAKVDAGTVSVSAAADISSQPKEKQTVIVARGEKEILEAAKQIRAERAQQRREEVAAIASQPVDIPEGRFNTIVIDPPWPMQKIERDVRPNQVEFDYPVMTEEELRDFKTVISNIAADTCHMFMWTTQRFLPLAINLFDVWGFKYVLTMVWHKPGGFQPIGLPQYNCEFVVYGRKGAASFVETKAFNCCFEAGRREHSRKPDEFYDLIKRVAPGPHIDVFSRDARDGFEQFGNEVQKFAGAAE